jgi:hypothetical protein
LQHLKKCLQCFAVICKVLALRLGSRFFCQWFFRYLKQGGSDGRASSRGGWFTGPSIPHGRQGIVKEQDTAGRSLVVQDDAGECHAITFDSLLPW